MATVAERPRGHNLLNGYAVFWHVWPQLAVVDGEVRPIGFEMELVGSHSTDPNHVNPACRECQQVRLTLLALAEHVAEQTLSKLNGSVTYNIDPHWTSIICSATSAGRTAVPVSIFVTRRHAFSSGGSNSDDAILALLKRYLLELGIPEH